jgi:peroxiredoxin
MDTLIMNGVPAPHFTLPDLEGVEHTLLDYRGQVVVVNFWSAECPYAARADELLMDYLETWGEEAALLPLASNVNEPAGLLKRVAHQRGLPPVLHDTGHQVADLYGAATTPHLFVLDRKGILRYQGALDDVTFRQREPTQAYLYQAVEAVLAGEVPDPARTMPYGCTIVRFSPGEGEGP